MKILIAIHHADKITTRNIDITDRTTLASSVAEDVIKFLGEEAIAQHQFKITHYQYESLDGSVIASGTPQQDEADLGIPEADGVLKIKLDINITPKKFHKADAVPKETFETIRTAISELLETDTGETRTKAKKCIEKAAKEGTIVPHLPALREYLQKHVKEGKGKPNPAVNEVRSWLNEATPLIELPTGNKELLIEELQQEKPKIEFIKKILHGITSLSLEKGNITDLGVRALAEVLKSNTTLTSLNLEWNRIGGLGAIALAEALTSNTTLTSLNLEWNHIGCLGAKVLAEALKSNATLTSLYLWHNHIGNPGATDLAEALKSNATLTSLHLGNNQIGYSGATDLAEALKSNATLTFLNLERNQIGDPGATDLAEALKSNATLTSLSLDWNDIRAAGVTDLAEALERNFSLTSLSLFPSSSDIYKTTDFYLQRNKNRLAKASEYLKTSFVKEVAEEINLISPLTEIIGDYLTPHDLTSECDITGSAAGMSQFGLHAVNHPYSEKEMKQLKDKMYTLLASNKCTQDVNSKELIYVNVQGYTVAQRVAFRNTFTLFFEKYYAGRNIPTANILADENGCRLIITGISLECLNKILYVPQPKEEVAEKEEAWRISCVGR